MYDKLGELLSERLDKGEENKEDKAKKKDNIKEKKHYTSNTDSQDMHKYTKNMQFSIEITFALRTLDIAYPFTKFDIKSQYRKLLKKYHPDTSSNNNTIQDTKIVDKLRQLQFEKLQEAYKTLKDYFEIE